MDVFDLAAKITLDTSGYEEGLTDAEKKASTAGSKIGNALKTASAVGAAAFTALATTAVMTIKKITDITKSLSEQGDHIDKQSQKIGISAEAYQEWAHVLDHAGASVDGLQASMKILSTQAQANAAEFAELGITQEELTSLNTEELFSRVVSAMQKMEAGTKRTAYATKLLGRGATELAPLLNMSAEETDELRKQAHELGLVLSDETVKISAEFQDSLTDLGGAFNGLKNRLAQNFLPGFITVVDGMTDLVTGKDGAEQKISKGLNDIIDKIVNEIPEFSKTALPTILSTMGGLANDIIRALPATIQAVSDSLKEVNIPKLVSDLLDALDENTPAFIKAGLDLFSTLLDNVVGIVDALSEKFGTLLVSLVREFTKKENIQKIIDGGVNLLIHLVDDVDKILDGIMDGIFALIDGVFDLLTDPKALAKMTLAGLKLGAKLIAGFLKTATGLSILEKIPGIGGVFKGFTSAIDSATESIIGNIDNMIAQLEGGVTAEAQKAGITLKGEKNGSSVYENGSGGRSFEAPTAVINVVGAVDARAVAAEVENALADEFLLKAGVSVQ